MRPKARPVGPICNGPTGDDVNEESVLDNFAAKRKRPELNSCGRIAVAGITKRFIRRRAQTAARRPPPTAPGSRYTYFLLLPSPLSSSNVKFDPGE